MIRGGGEGKGEGGKGALLGTQGKITLHFGAHDHLSPAALSPYGTDHSLTGHPR
jgi:hypothetical protein